MFNKEDLCTMTREEINQTATNLLHRMTLKEKVWMLNGNWDMISNQLKYKNGYNPVPIATTGVKRLGIPPIKFCDGPRGAVVGKSTCFPVSMARGASFDRDLERRIGDVIAKEIRAQNGNFFGGVCVNLLRHPAWGRAQETYGEDPYLVGEMGACLTEGIQAHNVIACVKHYAFNNIENSRFFVNVQADDRTLHEVYLAHFKRIIIAGAASVMGAYNLFREDQACESRLLLTEILREKWGFEGFTISDFIFGVRDGKKAIEAGLDIEMPLPVHYNQKLLNQVKTGEVPESTVDQAVLRVLRTQLVFQNTPDPITYSKELVTHSEHIALAQEAAEKSMVLIKNESQVMPFRKDVKRLLVLGKLADQENTGDHGSSRVYPPYVITPLQGLKKYLGDQVEVLHRNETQLAEAKQLAKEVDCVIVIAGNDYNDEGEYTSPSSLDEMFDPIIAGYKQMGKSFKAVLLTLIKKMGISTFQIQEGMAPGGDRQSLSLKTEQIQMIQSVAGINPNMVVCLVTGSMIMLDEWSKNIPAIMYSWYAGMEGGTALARILFGDVNPSGKLPFSIPTSTEHLPYFSSTDKEITYGLYHGYSLLDKNGQQPAYPFGFGLGYTQFDYSDLSVSRKEDRLDVSLIISNTGQCDGEEVVQVYVGKPDSKVERQKKLLKGYKKILIPVGQSVRVSIPVLLDDLRYYDVETKQWVLEEGEYHIMVGGSSEESNLLTEVSRLTN